MRFSLICIALLMSPEVWCESPVGSNEDYYKELGQLYGVVLGARLYKQICAESFSEMTISNEEAFQEWRKAYRPLIGEIDSYFSSLKLRESIRESGEFTEKPNSEEEEAFFDKSERMYRQALTKNGPEGMRNACRIYPAFLKTEMMNLEVCCVEQFQSVRRGRVSEE